MRKAGFDITMFKPGVFEVIMEKYHLEYVGRTLNEIQGETVDWAFHFKGPNIDVFTQNNPVTGEYWNSKLRQNQRGFASYIGVEGNNDTVESFCQTVLRMCEFYKEYDPTERGFI